METNISFNHLLDASLRRFFLDALRVCLKHPPQAASLLRTVFHQSRAARRRAAWRKRGLHVPPIMICSVTTRCNLSCKGCYARILRPARGAELSGARLREILGEAEELGIRFLVIAGGEPFLRPDLLELTRAFPRLLFLVFSNGLLIQGKTVHELARQRNVVPVLSLEGYAEDTDLRRGNGVYSRLQALLPQLKRRGIFFSVSLTVTRGNLASVTEERFIRGLVQRGCRLFFFIEYSPIKEGTEDWALSEGQRLEVMESIRSWRKKYPALFIWCPGTRRRSAAASPPDGASCTSAPRGSLNPVPLSLTRT